MLTGEGRSLIIGHSATVNTIDYLELANRIIY